MSLSYRSSRPDQWTSPKPYADPGLRRMHYGRIQPLDQPGWIARLLRRPR